MKPKRKTKRVRWIKNPSRMPQKINETNWYYEEPNNLLLVHEVMCRFTGKYILTDQIKIPWRMIFNSINRKPNPNKP